MIKDIKKIYNDFVSNKFINYDAQQENLLTDIQDIWNYNKKINFFSKSKKYYGVYVYGSVGIGKT